MSPSTTVPAEPPVTVTAPAAVIVITTLVVEARVSGKVSMVTGEPDTLLVRTAVTGVPSVRVALWAEVRLAEVNTIV
jgi:hypothetical protein